MENLKGLLQLREGMRKAKITMISFFVLTSCIMWLALAGALPPADIYKALWLPVYIVLGGMGFNVGEYFARKAK